MDRLVVKALVRPACAVVAAAVAALLAWASVGAHANLLNAFPAPGEILERPTDTVYIEFSETLVESFQQHRRARRQRRQRCGGPQRGRSRESDCHAGNSE